MYIDTEILSKLDELLQLKSETEVVEFKHAANKFPIEDIGKYFSALSNEANLKGEPNGWLVFGIEDKTHDIKGTNYKPSRAALDELKKLIADQTTNRITFEEIYEDRQPCNNQSIRERFGVGRQKMSMVSHVISDTVKAGLIAISKPDNSSKKYVAYVPFYV